MKLKKGDLVQVTVGRDSGRQSRVEKIFPKEGAVLVPGVNQYKKHRKPVGENRPGEIVTIDRPISVSKVALFCPRCKQPTRVGYRTLNGKKVRICRKCDMEIDENSKLKSQKSKPQRKG